MKWGVGSEELIDLVLVLVMGGLIACPACTYLNREYWILRESSIVAWR